jgi:hypothetical protein
MKLGTKPIVVTNYIAAGNMYLYISKAKIMKHIPKVSPKQRL